MTHAAFLAALAGCTTTRTVVLETPLSSRIPMSLHKCSPRPAPDALERQSDVARYVFDLDTAGADCRSKLGAVKNIVRSHADKDSK